MEIRGGRYLCLLFLISSAFEAPAHLGHIIDFAYGMTEAHRS
jgi:hypothetical protein